MGFFQDLKEDLSIAVDELANEGAEDQGSAADAARQMEESLAAINEAGKEVAEAAAPVVEEAEAPKEEPKQESEPEQAKEESADASDDMDVMPSEDLAKALEQANVIEQEHDAISPDGKAAPVFGEQMQLDLGLAAVASEQTKEKTPKAEEKPAASDPTIEAAANELKSIANIVNKEETVTEAAAEEDKSIQTPEEMMAETEVTKNEPETAKDNKPVEALTAEDMAGDPVDENAVITKCMTVRGDVLSKGSIEIQGIVEGNVTALGKLNVSGNLQGDAKAAEVFADAARISGQIHADGTAKIGKDSVIIGNIFATSAVIAGAVKGDIDVHGPVILDSSAIVMGNIKSKSVQINNGAAIEGMCSQCYAENSPSSFFDRFGK